LAAPRSISAGNVRVGGLQLAIPSHALGMADLSVIFMGTPDLACASLQALLKAPGIQVSAVVTQPDRPKGRELKLRPPPVKELAHTAGIPVLQPAKARDEEFIKQLRKFAPDLIAVAAYGQLLPQSLLELPRFGCVNVHTSLLPKYRGAGPIQWAILNDERETGVTIMKMDAGLDTGPILAQATTAINAEDNAETLHDRLARLGAELLVLTIPGYVSGEVQPWPQPVDGVVYAPKIKKHDGRIDWAQPARVIWNRVRGLMPWPGAFTFMPAEPQTHLLKIWQAEVVDSQDPDREKAGEILAADKNRIVVGCSKQSLRILSLQLEGGRRLTAREFLAGHSLKLGLRLG
jgi:methionyl-tRNA formyltransferase